MQQLMSSVKMIVMLQPMLEPLKKKIEATVQHMQPEEAEKAMGIMKHILALDVYSKVTTQLLAGVVAAKKVRTTWNAATFASTSSMGSRKGSNADRIT